MGLNPTKCGLTWDMSGIIRCFHICLWDYQLIAPCIGYLDFSTGYQAFSSVMNVSIPSHTLCIP